MSAKKPAEQDDKKLKKEKKVMARTKVIGCKCPQSFQDAEYGRGQRLHNLAPGNKGTRCAYRCTGCKHLVE